MRAGCSKEIITPIKPIKLACVGDSDKNFSYIHDDVYVRCLALDDGKKMVVLMSVDLLFHDALLNDAIACYANEKYGIDKSSVTVGYTHSHTSPASRGYNRNHHDDEYEELLLTRAKACLDRAVNTMFEAELEHGTFDADFNISRRGQIDGKFVNRPDFDYPRDREFSVLCVRDISGNVRSVIANYACHPVFYPTKDSVSGEFPARLCQLLDTKYYGAVSLFFQSSAGDVRPRPAVDMEKFSDPACTWPWKHGLTFSDISVFAEDMCREVSKLIENGGCTKKEVFFDSNAFEIELPMDGKPIEYFIEEKVKRINDPDNVYRNNAIYISDGGYEKLSDSLMLRASVIKLSDDLYIATLGGEPCFGVRKAIERAFGDKKIIFIGYTDACAYIVDDRILSEGGYEPTCHLEYCLKGPFKPGLDARYTNAFEKALQRMK
ncbi:MAG: hypothetical protein IJB42_06135 [Oscillospiraceae bacterium]|nr:hypothetical protein [Oscillospiraceae bacterium]MBQ3225271.1 hypothetical protein [Oscillospiraceae bacterium]MBQ6698110.1 hypothetical protein [Oscillospiraceae bacterium]